MSRRAKGPRLWLRPARADRPATWHILDGVRQRSLGLGASEIVEAEKALADYLAEKHTAEATTGLRDPSQILIDDVLTLYAIDVAPQHARPHETASRIKFLRAFWSGRALSEVVGKTCREYVRQRSTPSAARRELEDLRAAINYHRTEGLHDKIVSVVLPDAPLSRERWLTREEAARLIWHAWRYREKQNLRATDRRTRKHVAKFMLVARYMGSRAGVICSASIEPKRPSGRAWVDLSNGVFYGRAVGERKTKKQKQTVRVPPRLLAHLRRWQALGQKYVVEWNGRPVSRISKAHTSSVTDAGLDSDVTPHIWRHSAITWAMQRGADPWKAADFFGLTVETLLRVYGHHHPDHSADVHRTL